MNYLEKIYWEMQKNCISYARSHESVWINNSVIKTVVEALEKKDKDLNDTVKAQVDNIPEGLIAQKNQELVSLGRLLYRLSRNLTHFSRKNDNLVLLKIVDINETSFISGEEKELLLKFRSVLDVARTNLASLADYNVTDVQLNALETQLAKLNSIPNSINVVTGNRRSATRSIKELNAEARNIFDQLDDAIEGIITDDKFIEGWFDARKIKGRHVYVKKNNGENTVN